MRVRTLAPVRALLVALVLVPLAGCGGDGGGPGDGRADQAREAALEAGLDEEVAEFLALAARGPVAIYEVTYPGPEEGSAFVVANRPPDRRVDVVVGDDVTEIRFVLDGEAFECTPGDDGVVDECRRTDALVEPPGLFRDRAMAGLTSSLRERADDFTFRIEERSIAGVGARCLVTERREGRDRPELGDRGEVCVSPEGALLRVEQAGEALEATTYTTQVPEGTFVLPSADHGEG